MKGSHDMAISIDPHYAKERGKYIAGKWLLSAGNHLSH